MTTNKLLPIVLFCTMTFTLTAQWVKQTLPNTIGTPHLSYPGLNKSSFGKNYLMMYTINPDGNSTQVGDVQALRSTDGGRTYKVSPMPASLTDHIYNMHILDAKTSYLTTNHKETGVGTVYRTVDSGATWQALSFRSTTFVDAALFFDQNNGIVVCDADNLGAYISYTTNGGNTFTRLPQSNLPRPSEHEAFAGGLEQRIGDVVFFPSYDTETGMWRVWRTTDRGRNWTAGAWVEETSIFGMLVVFTDANNGVWIQGGGTDHPQTFSTTNGGATWQMSGDLPGIPSGGPITYVPNTSNIVAIFEDRVRKVIFSAITNDYGKSWNTKKDVAPLVLDTIYNSLGIAPFAWTNLDIIDNTTAWAKLSRTELYKYSSTAPIVPEKPDLELSFSADRDDLPLWGTVKFTLTIRNRGISKATGIRSQWLPPYKRTDNGPEAFANMTNASYASKGRYDWWTGMWSIDELVAGESATVNFHLFVVKNNANVTQTAQIMACNEGDLDSSPNNMTATSNEDDEARMTSKTSMRTEPNDGLKTTTTIGVFPNPTTDKLNVAYKFNDISDVTLTLTDISGRVVVQKMAPSVKTGSEVLSMGDLGKGIYFLRLTNDKGESQIQKVMKN